MGYLRRESEARAIRHRPAYATDGASVRLADDGLRVTYQHASVHIGWPALTKVVLMSGFWVFFSGPAPVLAFPEDGLTAGDTDVLGEFVVERGLLWTQ